MNASGATRTDPLVLHHVRRPSLPVRRRLLPLLALAAVLGAGRGMAAEVLADNYTGIAPALEDQTLVASNAGATAQPGEPDHWPGQAPRHSLWTTFRAPRDGVVVVDTTRSDFPTVVAVYEGKTLTALTLLGRASAPSVEGTSEVVIGTAVAGREYDIAVDGYRGATGTVVLHLRLVTAPEVRRQPSPVTVSVDENAALSVAVLGYNPTTIQWQSSATPGPEGAWFDLLGKTGDTLSLRAAKESDAGFYRVRASNKYGTVFSEAAEVTVQAPPKITQQPADTRRNAGESVDFSAGAVGGKPLSWRWQFKPLSGADFEDVPGGGVAQSVLSRSNLGIEWDGYFRAIVTNFAGSATTQVARLTVVAQGPLIVEQPVSLTVIEGSPASFRVRATGYQPIDCQWKRDGADIPGATGFDLRLAAAAPADAGGYSAVVRNRYGLVTSGTARLTVESRPPNDDFERRLAIGTGATARVKGSTRLATFQPGEPRHVLSSATNSVWYSRDATDLRTLTVTVTILSADFDSVVAVYRGDQVGTLTQVAANDDAIGTRSRVVFVAEPGVSYSIAVAGVRGASGSFEMEVSSNDVGPPIANPPLPPLVEEVGGFTAQGGGCNTVTLSMPTVSLLPVSYRWFHDGVLLPGETTSTLVLRNLTVEMQGTYTVEARSDGGVTTSSTVVKAIVQPVIRPSGQPSDLTVRRCQEAVLQVNALSCSALTYQWRRDGAVLPGQSGHELRLGSVTPADAGGYDVVVANGQGSTTSRIAQVSVDSRPRITRQPGPDQTVKLCDSFTLDIGTEDPCGTPSFQWNFQDGNGSGPLPGQTNRTLRLTATAGSAGDYWATVATRFGRQDSSRVRIRVDAAPVVSASQPTNQVVLIGENLRLRIQAEDRCGGLIYRWQRRATSAGAFSDVALDDRHRLLSDGGLETLAATVEDGGEHRCVVGNGTASVTSRIAQITVKGRPSNDMFANAYLLAGPNPPVTSIENLFATAEVGEPAHARRPARRSLWYRYQTRFPCEITVDTSGRLTLGGAPLDTVLGVYQGSRVDALTEVTFDDQGGSSGAARVSFLAGAGEEFYFAVDSKSPDWGTVRLHLGVVEIQSAPSIRVEPSDRAGNPGSAVTLTAETFGSPTMDHVWLRNGIPLGRDHSVVERIAGTPGAMRATLTLPSLQESDQGLYTLVASNSLGVATSRRATVTLGVLVRGRVVDASTGEPIPDAVIRVGSEWTTTDASGDYTLIIQGPDEASPELDAVTRRVGLNQKVQFVNLSTQGTVVLSCSKTNLLGADQFIPYIDRQFKVRRGMEVLNSFALSPILAGMRAVGDWRDSDGTDLDLYCVVTGGGASSVIYFKNPGRLAEAPFVHLELDRKGVTGPETANIGTVRPGWKYHFYLVKYDRARGSLGTSAAVFRIYDRSSMVGSRSVPASGGGEVWDICEVDGDTRAVTWVDRILSKVPFAGIPYIPEPKQLSSLASHLDSAVLASPAPVTGVGYEWDFGDGNDPSKEVAPTHPYRAPGLYSVSLTMRYQGGSGPSFRAITKTNFIEVFNLPPTVAWSEPANGTFFRAGDPISVQATASDPDGRVRTVELFEIIGSITNRVGVASQPPFRFAVPSDLKPGVRRTNRRFFVVATDEFGATARTGDLGVSVIDLSGEVLVLWSDDVPRESPLRTLLSTHAFIYDESEMAMRPPRLAEHNQEGLRYELVRGFRLIVYVQQERAPAMQRATVEALASAWEAGSPIYLLVGDVAACAGGLDVLGTRTWEHLTGVTARGVRVGPGRFVRSEPTDRPNELFWGPWGTVEDFDVTGSNSGFELSPTEDSRREVRATMNEKPVLVRFPSADLIVPFEARLLVQSVPVPAGAEVEPPNEPGTLFLNAVSFLLGNDCDDFIAALDCPDPEISGNVGDELVLRSQVTNNGRCGAGGIIVSNTLPAGFQFLGAECASEAEDSPSCEIRRVGDSVLFGLGGLPAGSSRTLVTRVRPLQGGTFTNTYAIRANGRPASSCQQAVSVASRGCAAPHLWVGRNGLGVTLIAEGTPGCEAILEKSTDLRTWAPVVVRTLESGPTVLSTDPGVNTGPAFFRVRLR